MLKLVLKTGDMLQIGDNVTIKLQSESKAHLAIEAPREVNIKRMTAEKKNTTPAKIVIVSNETGHLQNK